MRGTIYALAPYVVNSVISVSKVHFLIPAERRARSERLRMGRPLLARAVLLKQRSKTRVFETPASASPDLFYEPVHSTRVNQPAAAARRPR